MQFERKVRQRNLFDPTSSEPYKLSRSRFDSFIQCQRCFYVDRRLGVDRPSIPGYTLNSAVDVLLKNEFDSYRKLQQPHPLQSEYAIDALPFMHERLDEWRNNRRGIQFFHQRSGFLVFGAVDDIWINSQGELLVVDYKATSVKSAITAETHLRSGYRRQLEIYQWLFRQNGFPVSNTAYLVYANGLKDKPAFDSHLEFDLTLLEYQGNADWIENKLVAAGNCLRGKSVPQPSPFCEYCAYVEHVKDKT